MSIRIHETGEGIDSTLARTMEGHVAPEELLAVIDQYKGRIRSQIVLEMLSRKQG
jgi:hypothetical protein